MGSAVDNVERGSWKDVGRLDAGKLSQVLVEGDTFLNSSSLSDGNADAEDGVSPKRALIRGTIEFDEEIIDVLLGGDLKARLDQLRGNDVVDVGNGL